MTGIEWLVDARGCDAALLRDRRAIAAVFDAIIGDLALRVVGQPQWHVFPGAAGITAMCMLAESHLTVHTFPEHGSLCLNLFCCRERPDWDFEGRLRGLVGATAVRVQRLAREYADQPAALPA